MAIIEKDLYNMISEAFPKAEIKIKDLAGDGDHYAVEIICPSFAGKSLVAQHKMVNQALKDILGGQLHALSIKTKER
jgi:stress-induced morphogen